MLLSDDSEEQLSEYAWRTDCYVIGKYSDELRQSGFFNQAISEVLRTAEEEGKKQQALEYMEEMVKHGRQFFKIDDASRPVLVYKGNSVCHDILNVMAQQLGDALEQMGVHVIFYDSEKEGIAGLISYLNQRFQAIIGMQSVMFDLKWSGREQYLHEYIYGPKYNFIFDHPIYIKEFLFQRFRDCKLLIHDCHHADFIRKYYHRQAVLFPPAGMQSVQEDLLQRKYDITFIGTYENYADILAEIHKMERYKRFLASHFLAVLRKNPNLTAEKALEKILKKRKIEVSEDEFVSLFYELREVISCIKFYYRDKVVRTILDHGFQLDVYGDSWENYPLKQKYSNLICHPDVTVEEGIDIWRQSRLSLNVMSWHKAGFTERMAGIMLAGAVLVTDDTEYLRGEYDSNDMIVVSLDGLEKLPQKLRYILSNEDKRLQMAENGRQKTLQKHTWKKRAEQMIELIEKDINIDEKSECNCAML